MKHLFLVFFLLAGFVFSYDAFAVSHPESAGGTVTFSPGHQMTVNDFLTMDVKSFRTAEGKKLKWTQRFALHIFQKNLSKKVNKGRIEGTMTLSEAAETPSPNKYGRLSLIFSCLALVSLFLPSGIVFLGLALGGAGFVLGIIGLRKDEDIVMALIGTILGALMLFIFFIAAIWVSSFL